VLTSAVGQKETFPCLWRISALRSLSVFRDERILSFRETNRKIVLHDRSKLAERVCQPDPERR